MDVRNSEALIERLGAGLRSTTRRSTDLHLFAPEDSAPPGGCVDRTMRTLATLGFEDVEDVELSGFGPQNVLFDLELREINGAASRQIQVMLPTSNGPRGTFRCRSMIVLDVTDLVPGPYSLYGR